MRDLLIPFIVVWVIDFICSLLIIVFAVKYKQLGVKEFYHKFIVGFLIIAYYVRITELIFILSQRGDTEFNRRFGHKNRFEFLLVYLPLLFHGLTGFAYLFRWSSYLVLTTAKREIDEQHVLKRVKLLKIVFVTTWITLLVMVLVICLGMYPSYIFSIAMISFYFITAVLLVVVTNVFLFKLKCNKISAYRAKKWTIRCYTLTIGIWLVFRATNETFELIMQDTLDERPKTLQIIVDFIVLSSFFTELIPSLLINYVLWRSYLEMKYQRENSLYRSRSDKDCSKDRLLVTARVNDLSNNTATHSHLKPESSSYMVSKLTDTYEASDSESENKGSEIMDE